MDVKRMYCMIEKLAECAEKQFDAGIENIDTSEMGQVVDMMKDLAEAMYYRELTKAMQEFHAEDVMECLTVMEMDGSFTIITGMQMEDLHRKDAEHTVVAMRSRLTTT